MTLTGRISLPFSNMLNPRDKETASSADLDTALKVEAELRTAIKTTLTVLDQTVTIHEVEWTAMHKANMHSDLADKLRQLCQLYVDTGLARSDVVLTIQSVLDDYDRKITDPKDVPYRKGTPLPDLA